MCDCAIAKSTAQQELMALECRGPIRGVCAYWDFTRDSTGSTESSKQALADRVRNSPKVAIVGDFGVKTIQWEESFNNRRSL